MVEFCIYFENETQAEGFKAKIFDYIKNRQGIVVSVLCLNYYAVLIAVQEKDKKDAFLFLKEKIAEIILLFYKRDYILNKLDFDKVKSDNMKVFLEALFCFDSDLDKEVILENLRFKNTLYFDSFINFALKFLKSKWDELISLANENVMYIVCEESFLELIKFLISNLEHRCYAVNVFSKKDCYLLCDLEGKSINDFMVEKNIVYDDTNLLTTLIALNPEKIIFHYDDDIKESLIKKLYNYFASRIEICK